MARNKVKLQWITNPHTRRASYRKRTKGLLKKVSELSTLCGVSAAVIIYSPYQAKPITCPIGSEMDKVLLRFKSLHILEQGKKMLDLEGFFCEGLKKLSEQEIKHHIDIDKYVVEQIMDDILVGYKGVNNLVIDQVTALNDMAEGLVNEAQKKIRGLMESMATNHAILMPQVPMDTKTDAHHMGMTPLDITLEGISNEPWFKEMMSEEGHIGGDGYLLTQTPFHHSLDYASSSGGASTNAPEGFTSLGNGNVSTNNA